MDFSKSLKAFIGALPLKTMSGQQKFLALAAHCLKGDVSTELEVVTVRDLWPKGLLGLAYHANFYARADESGWVAPVKKGFLKITKEGLEHLSALSGVVPLTLGGGTGLQTFDAGQTHDFDKYLRGIFAMAQKRVWIADAYVDERIFDNVLDLIPATAEIHLLYNNKQGTFDARVARFKPQYPNFSLKQYAKLHDRFLLVDGIGYIIGPSIKDAASKSPALVVVLSAADSLKLEKFFQKLWNQAKI